MKIVLATDGSGHGDAAIDAITQRVAPPGSEVRVVSVVGAHFPVPYTPWEGVDVNRVVELEKEFRDRAQRPQAATDVQRSDVSMYINRKRSVQP